MLSENVFFMRMRPQIINVIGAAVVQLLEEKADISKESISEKIKGTWQEDDIGLAVELAIYMLAISKK
ncbi:hypothetical protein ACVTGX_20950 [Klebsiella grimontii]|nr:hypothetical protein [Klebsiella pneumoniae]HDT5906109.1 hypothetical protein [Klebsiella michiganensis]HDT5951016.1 hypothetical protein [Klebsiella michiganensis]HDT5972783.1 hypothetical protein [Klebsiella michiganensis]HDT5983894.1 hypothetical protein [Klebsiella michiganensis]